MCYWNRATNWMPLLSQASISQPMVVVSESSPAMTISHSSMLCLHRGAQVRVCEAMAIRETNSRQTRKMSSDPALKHLQVPVAPLACKIIPQSMAPDKVVMVAVGSSDAQTEP